MTLCQLHALTSRTQSSLGIAMKAQQGFNKEGVIHLVLAQHVASLHKNEYYMIVFS